jgi:hypothetical protein
MNKWVLAAMSAAIAGILLVGCGDEPRKTVSEDDICAAYKAQLDALIKDSTKTEQDKINQLPFLSGYSTCAEKVGTGGLPAASRPGSGQAPTGSGANRADADQRSSSAAAGS